MESHDQRVIRLAQVARERGIRVFSDDTGTTWFATSSTQAGVLYFVTALSCTCRGFVHTGACTHNAALLDRLGWLPRCEGEHRVTVPCSPCDGRGQVWREGEWSPNQCWYCDGSGQRDVVLDRIGPDTVIPFPGTDDRPAA